MGAWIGGILLPPDRDQFRRTACGADRHKDAHGHGSASKLGRDDGRRDPLHDSSPCRLFYHAGKFYARLCLYAGKICLQIFTPQHEKNLYKFTAFDNLAHNLNQMIGILHESIDPFTGVVNSSMENFQFTQIFQVRDYECDFQGIVNNSVYMNYLEHTRHEFAKDIGLDVVDLAKRGINLVVIRAELDYKYPLRSGDTVLVGADMERASRIRLAFNHALYLQGSDKLIMQARIILAPTNERGRPFWPDELNRLF